VLLIDEDVWNGPLVADFRESGLNSRSVLCNHFVSISPKSKWQSVLTLLIQLNHKVVCSQITERVLGLRAIRAVALGEDSNLLSVDDVLSSGLCSFSHGGRSCREQSAENAEYFEGWLRKNSSQS
jgi:hypothetical protein